MQTIGDILKIVEKKIIKPLENERQGNKMTQIISNKTYSAEETRDILSPDKDVSKMSVFSVKLFKLNDAQWVFDDEGLDIYDEAFVAGADTLIDKYMEDVLGGYDRNKKYVMNWSIHDLGVNSWEIHKKVENQFPRRSQRMLGSNWECRYPQQDIWLCPTFFEYYNEDITRIFFQIKNN